MNSRPSPGFVPPFSTLIASPSRSPCEKRARRVEEVHIDAQARSSSCRGQVSSSCGNQSRVGDVLVDHRGRPPECPGRSTCGRRGRHRCGPECSAPFRVLVHRLRVASPSRSNSKSFGIGGDNPLDGPSGSAMPSTRVGEKMQPVASVGMPDLEATVGFLPRQRARRRSSSRRAAADPAGSSGSSFGGSVNIRSGAPGVSPVFKRRWRRCRGCCGWRGRRSAAGAPLLHRCIREPEGREGSLLASAFRHRRPRPASHRGRRGRCGAPGRRGSPPDAVLSSVAATITRLMSCGPGRPHQGISGVVDPDHVAVDRAR